ncbi:methyltransferase domain-containing protein [Streptomyces sp. SID2999]|uniref:methyltransferase domain-containing protein n=1 Tax=Streptomyces sp. SID2999 TaxID=2690258 RepID=UPI001370482B|nr:methyltransferase domain-containing protein [Streptomyces sp. SID2999]MYZ08693.1 methyltransferase domain-containing protein [Streptomyces sp. SID2999]
MGAYDSELTAVAAEARAALIRQIDRDGAWRTDPVWRETFAEVPRHLFVPYYYVGVLGGYERHAADDPDPAGRERWARGAYADAPLATRLYDGELVSSSSQPSLMARMLVALGVRDGDRVLEVGTGTGYNAALLAHRLGDDSLVTTVDMEPEITEPARQNLARAGYHPVVVTGDGARGVPAHAPYDRIMATCMLPTVPRAWIAQCAPGARIIAPLNNGLLALDVDDSGRAEGRFLPTGAYFVPLRGESRAPAEPVSSTRGLPGRARDTESFRFLLGLVRGALEPTRAYALWEDAGMPDRERYGVTVSGPRAWAWLDDPEGRHAWPLP